MRPGLSFEVVRSAGPVLGIRTDRTAMIALTERGPVETPTVVHSAEEYLERFGCPVPGMLGPLAAEAYFDNGGEILVVTRVVPPDAAVATAELAMLGLALPGPDPSLSLFAAEPGSFANDIEVDTVVSVRRREAATLTSTTSAQMPGATSADEGLPIRLLLDTGTHWARISTVDLTPTPEVTFSPPAPTGTGDTLVELYEPTFALRIREPGRAEIVVPGIDARDLADARERLSGTGITIDPDASSALAADLPASGAVARMEGGLDGLAEPVSTDPAALTGLADSFRRAIDALEEPDLADIVIAPDLWSRIYRTKGLNLLALDADRATQLADELVRSAARNRERVVLLDAPLRGPEETRPASVREFEMWREERGSELVADRDFAAAYAPWTRIESDIEYRGDETLLTPPSPYVAGQMAETTRNRGPWIAAANVALEGVIGLSQEYEAEDEERLQAVGIAPLRGRVPEGATIQGVRSLSWPDRREWGFLTTRRLFNFLRRAIRPIGQSFVFEPNDPATWIRLRRDLERLLRLAFRNGAFTGSTPEEAFFVKVDESINPQEVRDQGILNAEIGVAPAVPLEFLVVRLVVRDGIADVTEQRP